MKNDKKSSNPAPGEVAAVHSASRKSPLLWTVLLLVLLLAVIFWRCFIPSFVLFSNDGPYGGMMTEHNRMPSIIRGVWANSNWFGNESLSPPLSVSTVMRLLTSPLGYCKLLCPASLFIVGLGACFCFRKLRLAPLACILGGIAATLNSDFFSTACWGVATQVIGFGFMYIAVGLVSDTSIKRQWIRVILAGLAVGVGVMEAYDIGALFSLFVAAFVVYHALFLGEGRKPLAQRAGRGFLRTALVAGFAGFIAIHTLSGLVGTQIKGVSGMAQDERTRAARWAEATQWSVPKAETLQVLVPGLFGFRDNWYMYEYDEPKEDQYWGSIGAGGGLMHLIGTGFYAGVPVVLIAIWAMLQSFRGGASPFTLLQRRAIWFWAGTVVLSLLFAYGKHAPFYQLFYAIPYASTIRNPQKFMHVFSWALVVLFAYGVHGLVTVYFQNYVTRSGGVFGQFKSWLAKASGFERKWIFGCFAAIGIALLAWLMYAAQTDKLAAYLETVGVPAPGSPDATTNSHAVVRFSLHAVGWFIFVLTITVGLVMLIFSGQFSGSRARVGGLLLGALLVLDLGRAAVPWLVYWDLDYKYVFDPVIQFLAEKPYEQRVAMLPIPPNSQQLVWLANAYGSDWKQHLFLHKNIQCADIVQEPRVALDKETFMTALMPTNTFNLFRFWELNNTRYLLGPNANLGPQFRVLKTFNFVSKPPHTTATLGLFGLTCKDADGHRWPAEFQAQPDPNGELAIIEFVNALPRAKLYSNWQVNTNVKSTLETLATQSFDPHQSVLVSNNIPAPAATNISQSPGTVEINPNYKSKRIELEADVKVPAVLLLSERYSPKWHVEVDGKPAELLRCNYIERGVYLTPGKHEIVMYYVTSLQTLYISLVAIMLGLGLWGVLIFAPADAEPAVSTPAVATREKSSAK
jgi:hypothetical protein